MANASPWQEAVPVADGSCRKPSNSMACPPCSGMPAAVRLHAMSGSAEAMQLGIPPQAASGVVLLSSLSAAQWNCTQLTLRLRGSHRSAATSELRCDACCGCAGGHGTPQAAAAAAATAGNCTAAAASCTA